MYFSWNCFPLKEKDRNAAALSILAKPPPRATVLFDVWSLFQIGGTERQSSCIGGRRRQRPGQGQVCPLYIQYELKSVFQ
jgi:hypothetical protein